jgi:hypothetical protein
MPTTNNNTEATDVNYLRTALSRRVVVVFDAQSAIFTTHMIFHFGQSSNLDWWLHDVLLKKTVKQFLKYLENLYL